MKLLDWVRSMARQRMSVFAKVLNDLSGGRISPNMVTITGLLAHMPIAWLIATRHYVWAAGLLVIFGLFDALDGGLARLQNKASSAGMLLDATTDRVKEVLLYSGVAFAFVELGRPRIAIWVVAACGASLCVSYVKAKGETAVKDAGLTPNEINRLFSSGLFTFEVRMVVLIIGLLTGQLASAIICIAIFGTYTLFERLIKISSKLK